MKNYKRLKSSHQPSEIQLATPIINLFDQYIETDVIPLAEDKIFNFIQYWHDRYYTQPDLARMAFDVLAVLAMSDECERLFSNAKIFLNDRRSRLKIDIIEASECLRAWYGPAPRKTFDDKAIGRLEGESEKQENKEVEDTGDIDEGDADEEGLGITNGEEDSHDIDAGGLDKDNELYCT